MPKRLIKEARFGTTLAQGDGFDMIGTFGLQTCVGLAVAPGQYGSPKWSIAHIDCAYMIHVVKRPMPNNLREIKMNDALFESTVRATAKRMQDLCGAAAGRNVSIVLCQWDPENGATDGSTLAIASGIIEWCNNTNVKVYQNWSGFYIGKEGVIQELKACEEDNNWDGSDGFRLAMPTVAT